MSNKNSLRLFIALPLDQQFNKSLNRLRNKLSNFPHLKIVPKDNLHLTLIFLGNIHEEEIPEIKEKIENIVSNFHSFKVKTSQLFSFKDMIWIKFEDNHELSKLQNELKIALEEYKLEKKTFAPHLTLARSHKKISKFEAQPLSLVLQPESVNLYASTLTEEGAEHAILSKFNFSVQK
jgi:2'-5' RNA ligase